MLYGFYARPGGQDAEYLGDLSAGLVMGFGGCGVVWWEREEEGEGE